MVCLQLPWKLLALAPFPKEENTELLTLGYLTSFDIKILYIAATGISPLWKVKDITGQLLLEIVIFSSKSH